jgi:hypothetical protein
MILPSKVFRAIFRRNPGQKSRLEPQMAFHMPVSTTRGEVASYVASVSTELANMARQSGLDTLEFLLEMIRLEAEGLNSRDLEQE